MKDSAGDRVLMLLENSGYPQDSRVRHEALTLARSGRVVTVVCPRRGKQPAREIIEGVRVRRYASPPSGKGVIGYLVEYGWAIVASMWLSLREFAFRPYAVLHAHNPPDLFVLIALLVKPFGVRFIFDHHDLSPEMYAARFGTSGRVAVRAALGFFERLSFRAADHVIATNGSYRDIAVTRGRVDESDVSVVRNGPDLERVRPVDPDPALALEHSSATSVYSDSKTALITSFAPWATS